MKVKELIEKLKIFNQEAEINIVERDDNPFNYRDSVLECYQVFGSDNYDGVYIVH